VHVIDLPASLDYKAVDALLDQAAASDGKALIDAGHVRWVDPCGIVALLAAGTRLRDRVGTKPVLRLPEPTEVVGYMARMGFFAAADGIFEMDGKPPRRATGGESDVLLEITPITTNSDVHEVVDKVQGRAGQILSRTLAYPTSAVVQFSVILSEVCQNILEHAEAPGWVGAQAYRWQKRLGKNVLVISVADMGRGFKGSLADEHSARFGDRWGDATALEAAFIHGLTRFPDSGRGQGIQQIRKQVRRWDGAISIRSGRARIADVPAWDDTPPLTDGMQDFPGAQITIILPGRTDDES
jgi:anti-sigma regulatory factor (Ser/Thr protein kinase)